jgi:hypothetical protein
MKEESLISFAGTGRISSIFAIKGPYLRRCFYQNTGQYSRAILKCGFSTGP